MFGNGAGGMEEGQAAGTAAKGEPGSTEEDQAVRLVVPAPANCKEPTKMWWFYVHGTKSSIKRVNFALGVVVLAIYSTKTCLDICKSR
jgi:hypothetical protein